MVLSIFVPLMLLAITAFFAAILPAATCAVDAKNELIYVQLMFRHGDRAPDKFYKKDPFTRSWPQGSSQLTTLGIEQQYALGQYLRSRYATYLNLDIHGVSYADVYVRSTDVERAISSAQTNTAAFFRPPAPSTPATALARSRRWTSSDSNFHTHWQPVPIHSVPEKYDYVMQQAECKRFDVLKAQFETNEKIQAIKREPRVQALLHALSYVTGEPFDKWTMTKTFKDVADALYCEHTNNMTLPNVPDQFYREVEALRERVWPLQFAEPAMAILRGGCILDTFMTNMRNKMDNKPTKDVYATRKLVALSGHDTTILGLIGAAGLMDRIPDKPHYTTTLFFEMYADGMVDILYKNNISSLEAIRTTPPVSVLKASLAELEARWKDVRLDETASKALCDKLDDLPAAAKTKRRRKTVEQNRRKPPTADGVKQQSRLKSISNANVTL